MREQSDCIQDFEGTEKSGMCEQSSHIRLKVSKIMEPFPSTFIQEVV